MTLEFISDAEWFGFEYDVQAGSSRSFYGFDLFVDGILEDSALIEGFASSATITPYGSPSDVRSSDRPGARTRPAPPISFEFNRRYPTATVTRKRKHQKLRVFNVMSLSATM